MVVRLDLGLTQQELAAGVRSLGGRMVESTVSSIETGTRGTSLHNVKLMAAYMCCTTDDLFNVPGAPRLAAIRGDFHQRVADEARAEAKAAS